MSWLDKGADGSEDHRAAHMVWRRRARIICGTPGLSRSVTTKSPETSDASRCSTINLRHRRATIRPLMNVPKPEFWNNADPERLPDAWRLTKVKGEQTFTAVCQVWAVELGWDLRLFIDGELMKSQVCRSGGEMVDRAEYWRAAFEVKGWA